MEPLLTLPDMVYPQPIKKAGRKKKKYIVVRVAGVRIPVHRKIAQDLLGRELLPGEVVHHRDGDSTHNTPENVLVLPSQRHHAHLEFHLRRENSGMVSLFPELLTAAHHQRPQGGLFDHLL